MSRRILPLLALGLGGCATRGEATLTATDRATSDLATPAAQRPIRLQLLLREQLFERFRVIEPSVSAFLWSFDPERQMTLRYWLAASNFSSTLSLPPDRLLSDGLGFRLRQRVIDVSNAMALSAARTNPRRFAQPPLVSGTPAYNAFLQADPRRDRGSDLQVHVRFEIREVAGSVPVSLAPGEHLIAAIENVLVARVRDAGRVTSSFPDLLFYRGDRAALEAQLLDRAGALLRFALEPFITMAAD